MTKDLEDEVLDDKGMAEYLSAKNRKVTPRTVRHYAREGLIRGKKIGKHWFFHRDAGRDYLLSK